MSTTMTSARDVLNQTHAALAESEKQIRQHEYIQAVRAGRVRREALRAFPGHQYHLWKSDLRAAAMFVSRFGDRRDAAFFADDLKAEFEARKTIMVLAAKMGMTKDDLEAYEPTEAGFAYAAYFAWLASFGSAAEIACGLTVNLSAWGYNCGQVSQGLREHYGFTSEDTAFLDGFAGIPSLDDKAAEIIQDDLDRGVEPREIIRAARLIQGYERMFWDAMAAA